MKSLGLVWLVWFGLVWFGLVWLLFKVFKEVRPRVRVLRPEYMRMEVRLRVE
jgi:hypothetical protein